jgi:hypothetical protein
VIAALDGNVGIVLATVPCCGSTPSGRSSSAKPPTSAPADFQLSGTGADNLQHRAPGRRCIASADAKHRLFFGASIPPGNGEIHLSLFGWR